MSPSPADLADPDAAEAVRFERHWCLCGPDLVENSGLPLFRLSVGQADALASVPAGPPQLARRLGRRFEAHWSWTLAHLPGCEVLAEGIQVREARRTIGELDLLVACAGQVWHLELAVKFYLCRRGSTGDAAADWIGPRGRDRLDLKLERMRTHQLALGSDSRAHATLTHRGLPVPDRSAAVLRGVRFADWSHPRTDAAGLWCTADERDAALPRARVLRRTEWLGFGPQTGLLTGSALADAVAAEHTRGAAQLVDPHGRRWLVLP